MNNSQLALSVNQRNVYLYYLQHKKTKGDAPCFVPKSPLAGNRLEQHLKAIEKLEERGYFRVHRNSNNYLEWVLE